MVFLCITLSLDVSHVVPEFSLLIMEWLSSSYLQVEWDTKKKEKRQVKDKLKGGFVKVPQQTNYSDCGVYLLQYVESFFKVRFIIETTIGIPG